ncbi:hypothetical protein GCM10020001_116660 [Nonomuraea salmonea]
MPPMIVPRSPAAFFVAQSIARLRSSGCGTSAVSAMVANSVVQASARVPRWQVAFRTLILRAASYSMSTYLFSWPSGGRQRIHCLALLHVSGSPGLLVQV